MADKYLKTGAINLAWVMERQAAREHQAMRRNANDFAYIDEQARLRAKFDFIKSMNPSLTNTEIISMII